MDQGIIRSRHGLHAHGLSNYNSAWWNLSTPALYEHILQRREGRVAHLGPLVVSTGQYPANHNPANHERDRVVTPSLVGSAWRG